VSDIQLTADETYAIRHALGLTSNKVAYRNRYCGETPEWEGLVAKGLAIVLVKQEGKRKAYAVRRAAAFAVLKHGERISDEEAAYMEGLELLAEKRTCARP
jgi:hypothetical protein